MFGNATLWALKLPVAPPNFAANGIEFKKLSCSIILVLKTSNSFPKYFLDEISNKIVNNNTSASIQSGFYFGYLHAVNGILKQIIKENNFKPKVYITGGLGKIFRDKIIYKPIYMEHLTLEGIKEIGNKHFYE